MMEPIDYGDMGFGPEDCEPEDPAKFWLDLYLYITPLDSTGRRLGEVVPERLTMTLDAEKFDKALQALYKVFLRYSEDYRFAKAWVLRWLP